MTCQIENQNYKLFKITVNVYFFLTHSKIFIDFVRFNFPLICWALFSVSISRVVKSFHALMMLDRVFVSCWGTKKMTLTSWPFSATPLSPIICACARLWHPFSSPLGLTLSQWCNSAKIVKKSRPLKSKNST